MREFGRIIRICMKLAKVWHHYPDLRFFQLLDSLMGGPSNVDRFYLEDTDLEAKLDAFLADQKE